MTEFSPDYAPETYPTDGELSALFTDATTWLQENRPVENLPTDAAAQQTHNDLPLIRNDAPMHSLKLHGAVVQEYLPEVAERLKLREHDVLNMTYVRPCYVQGRNCNGVLMDIEFRNSDLIATVEHSHPRQNGEIAEITRLHFDEEDGWEFTTDQERESKPDFNTPDTDRLLDAIFNPADNEEPATKQHFEDIKQVVTHMPVLHQAMQDAGFDLVNDPSLQQLAQTERRQAKYRAHALGELDGARAELFSEEQPSSSYEHITPVFVRLAGIELIATALSADPGKRFEVNAKELKQAKINAIEASVGLYWYGEDVVSEVVATSLPNPAAAAQGIDKVEQVITVFGERYVRQTRLYRGEDMATYDLTEERPLDYGFSSIASALHHIARKRHMPDQS